MKLIELEPQFYRYETRSENWNVVDPAFVWNKERGSYFNAEGKEWHEAGAPTVVKTGDQEHMFHVDLLSEAQGIVFLCPVCFKDSKEGVHSVLMPFAGRGVDPVKYEHQWDVTGSGYADLSTTPSYADLSTTPSCRIVGGCGWHGYITHGEVSITELEEQTKRRFRMTSYSFRGVIVPDHLIESLNAYRDTGRPTGGFLQAIIDNDLAGACCRADSFNAPIIFAICAYVYNELPHSIWGKEGSHDAWIEINAEKRRMEREEGQDQRFNEALEGLEGMENLK